MKKALSLIVFLLLTALLVSCGTGTDVPADSTAEVTDDPSGGSTEDVNVLDLISGEIESMSQQSTESTPLTTEPASDPSETTSQPETSWPVNEYTSQIPVPDFGKVITYSVNDSEGFSANLRDISLEEIRGYVKALKDAGFTQNAKEDDSSLTDSASMMSFDIVQYEADNGKYAVGVAYVMNIATIRISKK